MISIAVIPARGGSKRIPGKNIRSFCGRPMIHWPIAAAQASGVCSAVYVSTDDAGVAEVAREAGARVPRLRSAELSDDFTPLRPVIREAILMAEADLGATVDQVCMILATAALLTASALREGAMALEAEDCAFAFSAMAFPAPVQRAFIRDAAGGVQMLWPENRLTRSQDLPEAFYDAGQFYWGKRAAFMSDTPMYGQQSRMVLLPPLAAVDIDTSEDWVLAETLFKIKQRQPDHLKGDSI